MGVAPCYRVEANGSDISSVLQGRLLSLKVVDEAGVRSDSATIVLEDSKGDIVLPPKGANLTIAIGYDGAPVELGKFVVDELELDGPPDVMTITAKAAPVTSGRGGQSALQSMRSRSWPEGTTIADVVRTIAEERGLQAAVHASLEAAQLFSGDQVGESDANFLTRASRDVDAVIKVAGDSIVAIPRGRGESASGRPITPILLSPSDITKYRVKLSSRWSSGTVVARYRDIDAGTEEEVPVGSGEPVSILRFASSSVAAAREAARAQLSRGQRRSAELTVTLPGHHTYQAEAPLRMSELFREGPRGDWTTTKAVHELTPGRGYVCTLEADDWRPL